MYFFFNFVGSFLNFRCKLCKVRFTDLKEIHMRGRRHLVNLENIQIKPKPPPTPPTAPASDPKAKPVKKRVPAKRIAPVLSRTPAIIHGLGAVTNNYIFISLLIYSTSLQYF